MHMPHAACTFCRPLLSSALFSSATFFTLTHLTAAPSLPRSYVTAMLYRLIALRCARHRERASLFFGQLLVLSTLLASLLAVALVNAGAIGCDLGLGGDEAEDGVRVSESQSAARDELSESIGSTC